MQTALGSWSYFLSLGASCLLTIWIYPRPAIHANTTMCILVRAVSNDHNTETLYFEVPHGASHSIDLPASGLCEKAIEASSFPLLRYLPFHRILQKFPDVSHV
jgi:hypothetical protein